MSTTATNWFSGKSEAVFFADGNFDAKAPDNVINIATPASDSKKRKILIVDDEPDIRTMLRDLLQLEGYTVSEAADGVFGIDYLRASSRALIVLLDYKMPRMNGEEVLQVVMADPQLAHRHAFIFVTANLPSFSPALHQLLADAAIAVVQKPFQVMAILDEIERAIVRLSASPGPSAP